MFPVKPYVHKLFYCVKICISLSSLAKSAINFVITLPNWQIFLLLKITFIWRLLKKIVNNQQVKINNSAKFGALICQRNRNWAESAGCQKILLKQSGRNFYFSFILYSGERNKNLKISQASWIWALIKVYLLSMLCETNTMRWALKLSKGK